MQSTKLSRAIGLNVAGFFLFQTAVFVVAALVYQAPDEVWILFAVSSIAIHAALYGSLMYLRRDFVNLATNEPIDTIQFANQLTMFRITSAPIILALIRMMQLGLPVVPWLLAFTALAFVSDFLDGRVSRRYQQASRVGQYLDSSSDYIVLIIVGVAFMLYNLVDFWFFVATMIRFGAQWLFVGIVFVVKRGRIVSRATMLGKISVFAVMTLFVLSILQVVQPVAVHLTLFRDIEFWIEAAVAALLAVSLGEKVWLFAVELRQRPS